jgi:hypothetical protein
MLRVDVGEMKCSGRYVRWESLRLSCSNVSCCAIARLWILLPVDRLVPCRGGFEVSLEEQVSWWSSRSLSESE